MPLIRSIFSTLFERYILTDPYNRAPPKHCFVFRFVFVLKHVLKQNRPRAVVLKHVLKQNDLKRNRAPCKTTKPHRIPCENIQMQKTKRKQNDQNGV